MKTKSTATLVVLFLIGLYIYALAVPPTPTIPPGNPDQVCVAIVPADQARVKEAFGSILGLGRPATLEEISNATALWIGGSTHDYERRVQQSNFTPPPFSEGSGKLNAPGAATAAPTPKPKKK